MTEISCTAGFRKSQSISLDHLRIAFSLGRFHSSGWFPVPVKFHINLFMVADTAGETLFSAVGGFLPFHRDPHNLARAWVKPGTPGLEHRIGGLEWNLVLFSWKICFDRQRGSFTFRTWLCPFSELSGPARWIYRIRRKLSESVLQVPAGGSPASRTLYRRQLFCNPESDK